MDTKAPSKLTARVCVFCHEPKGTTAFRQDRAVLDASGIPHISGAFFAHLKCLLFWRRLHMTANSGREARCDCGATGCVHCDDAFHDDATT